MVEHGIAPRGVQLPLLPCSDAAGEVVEVGSDVSRVQVGDRVATHRLPALARRRHAHARGLRLGARRRARRSARRPRGAARGRPRPRSRAPERRGGVDAPVRRGHGLAGAHDQRAGTAGRDDSRPGHRRRVDLRAPVRADGRRARDRHLEERREARARAGARRVGDGQLRDDAGLGRPRARAHRRARRRPRGRGRRPGHDGPVDQGDATGRDGLADRRADRPRDEDRPAPDRIQGPARPGDPRRLTRDVRGHEPRDRGRAA